MDTVVVGQVARDLTLRVDEVPGPGGSAPVRARREVLGGKGANQAVGMAQLGLAPALVGVVGDDRDTGFVLDRACGDGVDVSGVVCRTGARTGLIVSAVDGEGRWRHLEDLPSEVLLTPADVDRSADALARAATVVLQLQQPADALLRAAGHARGTVVLDGAPPAPDARDDLLAAADVLRADATEAGLWLDTEVGSADEALDAARALRDRGVDLVVLGAGAEGDVAVWTGGELTLPLLHVDVADTTGGGDAFVAGLVAALPHGPEAAVRWGNAAAGLTVTHLGGRPTLTRGAVERAVRPRR